MESKNNLPSKNTSSFAELFCRLVEFNLPPAEQFCRILRTILKRTERMQDENE